MILDRRRAQNRRKVIEHPPLQIVLLVALSACGGTTIHFLASSIRGQW